MGRTVEMANISNLRIPEFIYLDDQKVDMTLSVLEGSIIVQSKSQRRSGSSKRGGGKVGFQGFLGVGGGFESSSGEELEEVKKQNEYSRFSRLHKLLKENNGITSIETLDEDIRKRLQVGQIVEVDGYVALSPIDMLFGMFSDFMPLIAEGSTTSKQEELKTRTLLSFLQKGQRKGINAFIFPGQQKDYRFYASLLSEKLKASIHEFPSTLTTFGRITKILAANETVNLMTKYFAGLHLSSNQLQDLVNRITASPESAQMLGEVPSLDDMLVKYPSVGLSPIAIYR